VIFAALCLLVALPLILLLIRNREGATPETPLSLSAEPPGTGWASSFGRIASDPQFWQATLIFGVMSGVFLGLNLHLFLYLTDQGFEAHRAVWVLSVEGFFAIVSKPLSGWIADRKGTRRALLLTVFISVIATALLPGTHTFIRAMLVGSLLGFGFGSILSLQAALISRMFSPALYARAYGAIRLTTFPFSIACPLLFGFTFDQFGSYEPGFYIAAALLLLVLPAAWRLRPAMESAS
jgi:MFS family permease